jgi:hypothetical protein
MPASKSSANLRASKLIRYGPAIAFLVLAGFALFFAWAAWSSGWTTAYGDAEAHLNIARRITDSRTPGPSQIGTVWLPLSHLLMAPFAAVDALWFNGLAGVIPSFLCYLLATVLLYRLAGLFAGAVFALNPNMLYLAATPMTEPIMAAALAGLLYATLRYRDAPSARGLLLIAAVSDLASLTRYDGWFLIPFIALFVWNKGGRKHAIWFAALAALAPLAWLAHNQYYYGDPLAFYRGPYSAQAILARQLAEGMPQPAMGSWWQAIRYYSYAVKDVIGWPILIAAACGTAISLYRRQFWPLAMLVLPGVFYIWSIHSGGTPVFVRELEPHTWYNTRYALAVLPFVAVATAALPRSVLIVVAGIAAMLLTLSPKVPVLAEASHWNLDGIGPELPAYRSGQGIIFRFDTLAGVLRAANIPFREGLYQDNLPQWKEALADPKVFQREEWALAIEGDEVDQAVKRQGNAYRLMQTIQKGDKAILVYRLAPQ